MSQNSIILPTTGTVSGLQMTQYTNLALDTLNTLFAGLAAPSSPEAGQFWHDTNNNQLKIRDIANSTWIVVGNIDETNKLFIPALTRTVLTANRNYYVSTTGSDSNNGTSVGTPFLTLQKAINVAQTLDLNGYNVTINVADGTYTSGVTISQPFVGGGNVSLVGNTTTPSNCVISAAANNVILCQNFATIYVSGFKLQTSGGNPNNLILASNGGQVYINSNMNFGATSSAQHLFAVGVSSGIFISASYTVSGNANSHFIAINGGYLGIQNSITITISGTPAFGVGFAFTNYGLLNIPNITFSGSATGSRYASTYNGFISTNGAGTTYLPGNSAGSTSNGGLYA